MRIYTILILASIALAHGVCAEEVKLQQGNRTLNANLKLAEGKTLEDGVILMTHGTLAHNGMEIITTLQELFNDNGYSTLAINLSFGLDDRHGFYDCNVPHNHLHTDALDEIGAWLAWLKKQGVDKVVLLGHSRGGNQAAWFAAERDDPVIDKIILIAPQTWSAEYAAESYESRNGKTLAPLLDKARSLMDDNKPGAHLEHVDFIYCKDTTVSAETFVSYYSPDEHLDTPWLLPKIKKPVLVFTGSEDQVEKVLDKTLAPLAEDKVIRLVVIEGADHSFRDLYTDELVESAVLFIGKE